MRISFDIERDTDLQQLMLHLRGLATVVEIATIGFDPWSETSATTALEEAGFPTEKLFQERRVRSPQIVKAEWPKPTRLERTKAVSK